MIKKATCESKDDMHSRNPLLFEFSSDVMEGINPSLLVLLQVTFLNRA